jgi:hypothetical protein
MAAKAGGEEKKEEAAGSSIQWKVVSTHDINLR